MFSGDTECFNGKVWKRLEDYKPSDKVLAYNKKGNTLLVKTFIRKSTINNSTNGSYKFYENLSEKLPFVLSEDAFLVCKNGSGIERVRVTDMLKNGLGSSKVVSSCNFNKNATKSKNEVMLVNNFLNCYRNGVLFDCELVEGVRNPLGEVVFTDYIFRLHEDNKRKLLSTLGLMGTDFCFKTSSKVNAERLSCLYNMLNANSSACVLEVIPDELYKVVPAEIGNEALSNGYNVVLSNVKYSIVVNSGMVIVRRKGVIFAVGM